MSNLLKLFSPANLNALQSMIMLKLLLQHLYIISIGRYTLSLDNHDLYHFVLASNTLEKLNNNVKVC